MRVHNYAKQNGFEIEENGGGDTLVHFNHSLTCVLSTGFHYEMYQTKLAINQNVLDYGLYLQFYDSVNESGMAVVCVNK